MAAIHPDPAKVNTAAIPLVSARVKVNMAVIPDSVMV